MMARSKKLRKAWLSVHCYIGLWLGLLLAVIGLTGSILVFYIELDEWLNPNLVIEQTGSERLSYQQLWQNLKASESSRPNGWRFEIPDHPNRAITARYYKPQETSHHGFAPLMVSMNPYTGEIISKRFWGQYLLTWLFDLHYTLLLDQTGKVLMAIVGVILMLSLLSGLYLWWPSKKQLRSAFSIKSNSSVQRYVYDLHKTSGVYLSIVLLILVLTGVALEVPQYVNPIISYFSSVDNAVAKPLSSPNPNRNPISLDQAVTVARSLYPEARLCWIEIPNNETGAIRINLHQAFEPSQRFPKTNVWVDQYTGQVVQVNNPLEKSAGTNFVAWLHPLHNGEAFGIVGRIVVFISGLVLPVLFVTGLMRWFHKRR